MKLNRFRYALAGVLLGLSALFVYSQTLPLTEAGDAYKFSFKTLLGGKTLPMSEFQGKVILVVNTASQCGFTPQYEQLEVLYKKYKDRGLVIVGVPSNDFGNQEPGSGEEIARFCKLNFGVSFPIAAKETVSGGNRHPFYARAREVFGFWAVPMWNFHKYLVDRRGHFATYFYSFSSPESDRISREIERLLAQEEKQKEEA